MIIPHEIIPTSWKYHWGFISDKDICILIITHLHIQGKINDKKRNSMFKSLREDNFIRKVNTYHCKINDTWYNDECMLNILIEVYNDKCIRKDLTIEEFVKYLNFYHNKKKNYCLDYIYYNYITPLIDNVLSYDKSKLLRKFNIKNFEEYCITYEEADRKYDLGSGYCCDDCDGCYTQYKKNRYHYSYEKYNRKGISNLFINYLNSLKTEGWEKNPFALKTIL